MPLLPPVISAFLPLSYIMLTFCRTGIRYDARHAYGLMTVIDGGCKNNYALSRTFKRSSTQIHPKLLRTILEHNRKIAMGIERVRGNGPRITNSIVGISRRISDEES